MNTIIKKTLVVLLIAAFGLFTSPHPSRAFIIGGIVFDPTALGETISNWALQVAKWLVDEGLVVLRDTVVKAVVDDMTQDIIISIDRGGTPLFVQDFGKFAQRSGDVAFSEFNRVLGDKQSLDLCMPFQPQLQVYFRARFSTDQDKFGVPVTCRFEQFKENLKKTDSFIQSGGWFSFQEAFYPGNNIFGAELAMEDAMMSRIARDQKIKDQEATTGKGFLSVKRCSQWRDPETREQYDNEAAVDAAQKGRCQRLVSDRMADSEKSCLEIYKEANCTRSEVKTPGQIVAESATKGVLKDFEYSENVQGILSAFINKMISKAFDATRGFLSDDDSGPDPRTYSSGGEQRMQNRFETAINNLARFENNYYEALQNATEVNGLAKQNLRYSVQAIYNCYYDRFGIHREDTGKQVYGAPTFGILVYNKSSAENFKSSTLSELVDMPIPASYRQYVETVNDYERRPNRFPPYHPTANPDPNNPNRSDYPENYPPHKGYFEKLIAESSSAMKQAEENGKSAKSARERVTILSKATSSVDLASSTTEVSNILSQVSREYSDFMKDHSQYVIQSSSAGGPGESSLGGSINSVLRDIMFGLNNPGYEMDNIDHTDFSAFYYCEPR